MNNSRFVSDCQKLLGQTDAKSKSFNTLLFTNGVLYSYGIHYTLLFKIKNQVFCNTRGYSNTTAKHISHCTRDHNINLQFADNSRYPEITYKSVKKCLNNEKKHLIKEISELSKRAWRQKENKEIRIQEIDNALKAITR